MNNMKYDDMACFSCATAMIYLTVQEKMSRVQKFFIYFTDELSM